MPDLAYSLEIAGAIPSDAMITDGSTEQINAPTQEEKRARVAALADVDENLFGTVTDEMRQAGRMMELENLEGFEVFESIAIEDCVNDKVLGTTWYHLGREVEERRVSFSTLCARFCENKER